MTRRDRTRTAHSVEGMADATAGARAKKLAGVIRLCSLLGQLYSTLPYDVK